MDFYKADLTGILSAYDDDFLINLFFVVVVGLSGLLKRCLRRPFPLGTLPVVQARFINQSSQSL